MSDKRDIAPFAPTTPLAGRVIVVTRATNQAGELTHQLEQLGARVIHCPTIEISEPADWAPVDAAIEALESYDWILFASRNSVEFFLNRLDAKGAFGLAPLSQLGKFAIGVATAKALQSRGVDVDLVAAESTSEGSIDAIVSKLGEDKVKGLKVLLPRARISREHLPEQLTRLGAHVTCIETYQTISTSIDPSSTRALFQSPGVDAITFTSPSTVSNLAHLLEVADLSQVTGDTLIACIGPTTAAEARQFGLTNIVQPSAHNVKALVQLLAGALKLR